MNNINKKDDWQTPIKLYKELDKEFNFTLDPCPVNPTFNGLHIKWSGSVFCNPPYSEVERWIAKGINEIMEKNIDTLVFLVFAKTDTKWYHKFIWNNPVLNWEIRFIKGRLKFINPNKKTNMSAPYPSMLLIWRKDGIKK